MNLNSRFRQRRFQEFVDALGVRPGMSILDVGGLASTWEGTGLEEGVTILNLRHPAHRPPPFRYVQGDARKLDGIGDAAFDIVFSNSVLEHVGGLEDQRRMAAEVRRVARRYWIQTPYLHFPLEIHFLFPFFQYLPRRARHLVARRWPFSFVRRLGLDPIEEADNIWLLDRRQFQALFPDAELRRERLAGLTKSLIALRT